MAVKLVICSSSDISAKKAEEMGMRFLPIPVSFGSEQ